MSLRPNERDEEYPVEPKTLLSSLPSTDISRVRPIAELEALTTPPPSYRSFALHDNHVDVEAYPAEDGLLVVDVENGASNIVNALEAELCLPSGAAGPPEYVPDEVSRPLYQKAPPLNVVIQIVGSRGDVQPFVALGQVLKRDYGHRVRIATHPTFKRFVEDHGLEFFSITGDPAQMMDFMVKNPGLMPKFKTIREGEIGRRRKAIFEIVEACWRSCIDPSDSPQDIGHYDDASSRSFIADAIIANPPSFAHIHCAEKLGIPIHMMFTMPWSPTRAFPHPLSKVKSAENQKKDSIILSYTMVEMMTWQGLGDIINHFRERTLGLEPLTLLSASNYASRLKIPFNYCWSPAFIPKPVEWGAHIDISGFFFLSASSSYNPDPLLVAFLESGPPPIYIGFGSIVVDDPTLMTNLIFEAVEKTGLRALVSKGWGGLGADDIEKPDNIFMLGNVPHDWLFKHVCCVVHHGGAGTTSAGIATGNPTVIVPFFGDQMYWGSMIYQKGAGPAPIPYKDLTAERLANAILRALEPDVVAKAQELGYHIRQERGNELGAQYFNDKLRPDDLRCSLAPNRVAVWKLKGYNLQVSAFAAAVLAENGLIGIDDLELFRSREWKVESGPLNPISGIADATIDTISGILKGVSDYPVEVMRATGLHEPASHSRSNTMDFALDPRKGVSRMIGSTLKAPASFAYGLAEGFNNLPKMYGDETVRETGKITGLGSGLSAAGKGFGYGLWDGVTGIFTQPVKGMQKEGLPGLWKGFSKGIGGAAFKPAAGAAGLIGYTGKGIYKSFSKEHRSNFAEYVKEARVRDGRLDLQAATEEEKELVLDMWAKVVNIGNVDAKAKKNKVRRGKGRKQHD